MFRLKLFYGSVLRKTFVGRREFVLPMVQGLQSQCLPLVCRDASRQPFAKDKDSMSSRKRQRLNIRVENDAAIVSLEDMEIWDGADLALLREALTSLIEKDGHRSLAVDLTCVKYIPSGFFGMLFEWYDAGLQIRLLSPQENVAQMLWFRMFFSLEENDVYVLSDEAVRNNSPGQQVEYHKRVFMPDDEADSEEDASELMKSVRYGIRSPERIR